MPDTAHILDYRNPRLDNLSGSELADYLVSVEAEFRIADGDRVVLHEPLFPVLELAWCLREWVDAGLPGDFVFDSMCYEELGAVFITGNESGWLMGSVFSPGLTTVAMSDAVCADAVNVFLRRVRTGLPVIGVPHAVLP